MMEKDKLKSEIDEKEENKVDYDCVLEEHVGQFGKYQILAFILLGLVEVSSAIYNLEYVFIMATPDHWCKIPALDNTTLTDNEIKNISIPHDGKEFKRCVRYVRNYTDLFGYNSSDYLDTSTNVSLKETFCEDGWEYDRSVYTESVVTQVYIPLIPIINFTYQYTFVGL